MTDTHYIDESLFKEQLQGSRDAVEEINREKEADLAEIEAQKQEAERLQAEQEDPHGTKDPSQFGLKENLTEFKNAVLGGARDTGSSFVTLP